MPAFSPRPARASAPAGPSLRVTVEFGSSGWITSSLAVAVCFRLTLTCEPVTREISLANDCMVSPAWMVILVVEPPLVAMPKLSPTFTAPDAVSRSETGPSTRPLGRPNWSSTLAPLDATEMEVGATWPSRPVNRCDQSTVPAATFSSAA